MRFNEAWAFWFTPVTTLTFGLKRLEVGVSPLNTLKAAPLAPGPCRWALASPSAPLTALHSECPGVHTILLP